MSVTTCTVLPLRNRQGPCQAAESGQPLGAPLKGHDAGVWSVAFSLDGKGLASASDDKTVRLWDAESGEPLGAPLKGHEGFVLSVAFSPDGKRLASASDDETRAALGCRLAILAKARLRHRQPEPDLRGLAEVHG